MKRTEKPICANCQHSDVFESAATGEPCYWCNYMQELVDGDECPWTDIFALMNEETYIEL